MDLSKNTLLISHTNISSKDYLISMKGGNMKKIAITLGILAMLGGNALAGYSSCTTTCNYYTNSCTTTCYDY